MKVNIFTDANMDDLMRRINKWFELNPNAVVRMVSQSSATHVNDEGVSTIFVAISIFFTE